MDNQTIQAIIEDGKKLASLAAPAFEAQDKLAALRKDTSALVAENTRLRESGARRDGEIRAAAEGAADFFTDCGTLKNASRAEFVDRLCDSPQAIFELARTFADKVAGESVGRGVDKTASGSPKREGDALDAYLSN